MPTVQAPVRGPPLGTSIRRKTDPKRSRSPSRELRNHLVIRNGGLELLPGIGVLDVRPVVSATPD
jgi:hypothetical protein